MNTKLKNKDLPKEYTKEMEEFNVWSKQLS